MSVLANAGPTGDHQHLGNEGLPHRLFLALGKRELGSCLNPRDRLAGVNGWPWRLAAGEPVEHLGDLPLGVVQAGQEDTAPAVEVISNDAALLQLEAEGSLDEVRMDLCFPVSGTSSSAGRPQCPSSMASARAKVTPARSRISAVFSMPSLAAI